MFDGFSQCVDHLMRSRSIRSQNSY
jgi:hypothetical protein